MFYALSHMEESFFSSRVAKFIALAPCTVVKSSVSDVKEWHDIFRAANLSAFDFKTENEVAQAEIDKMKGYYTSDGDDEPHPIKALVHFIQIGKSGRF